MLVPIIMGSRSDLEHGKRVAGALAKLGIPSEIRVASAHKAGPFLEKILAAYEANPQPKVYITIAGRSNALSAVIDATVTTPVIACPPYSDRFGGADIYSSLRMPSGVAPLTILDPGGAALAAAKILALVEPSLKSAIDALHRASSEKIERDDAELRGSLDAA